jgi:hypothetical protein
MTYFPKNIDPQLWTHANALCNGRISEIEMRELETILDADPRAQEFFVDFMNVNAEILWLVSSKQHSTMDSSPQIALSPPKQSPILGFLGDFGNIFLQYSPFSFLLLFLFIGVTLFAASYWLFSPHADKISLESGFVAQITKMQDCDWRTANPPSAEMTQLQAGRKLHLEKGLAQITYSNGAVVLLEGPASFTVDSSNSGFLSRGKLIARADTRQSWQFTIITPVARFIDLGTEFGVKIDELGRSVVAVFEGKVNAEAKIADGRWTAPVSFVKGEAAICTGTKFLDKSVSRNEFPSLLPPPPPAMDPAYLRWLQANQDMQKRQDLIAYYDFEPDFSKPNVLINRAPSGSELNGEIQNAPWVAGRFPDKGALEFKENKAGVRINLPNEYPQITLIAWIKINLSDNYHGILLSDNWGRLKELHWQIHKKGEFAMAVLGQKWGSQTERTFPRDCINKWCMVAGVIKPPRETIFYFNGEPFETLLCESMPAVNIGSATIGGWNTTGAFDEDVDRPLSGRMDELMIFKTALTPEEIKQIYESGKP